MAFPVDLKNQSLYQATSEGVTGQDA